MWLYEGYRFTRFLTLAFSCLGREILLGLLVLSARPDLYLRVSFSIKAMAKRLLSWPAPSSSLRRAHGPGFLVTGPVSSRVHAVPSIPWPWSLLEEILLRVV